jgi:hypothetical protein
MEHAGNGAVLPVLGRARMSTGVVEEQQMIVTFSTAPDEVMLRLVHRRLKLALRTLVTVLRSSRQVE